jgi:hypothetical protein
VVVLLLGLGWFSDQSGGVNRYVWGLFEGLNEYGVSSRGVTELAAATGIEIVVGAEVVDWR